MAGEVFGEGGGERAAEEMQVPFLGRIPMDPMVTRMGDAGQSARNAGGLRLESAGALRSLARAVAARVSVMQFENDGNGK